MKKKLFYFLNACCSILLMTSDEPMFTTHDYDPTVEDSDNQYDQVDHDLLHEHDPKILGKQISGQVMHDYNHALLKQQPTNTVSLSGPDENTAPSLQGKDVVPLVVDNQERIVESQKSVRALDDEFNKMFSVGGDDIKKIVTDKDRLEIKDLVFNQLEGKLTEKQIQIVIQVTDSYLEKLFEKILKRSIKRFVRHVIAMTFKDVRMVEKERGALTERDLWAICKKNYNKELARQAAKKKKYIQHKSLSKKQ